MQENSSKMDIQQQNNNGWKDLFEQEFFHLTENDCQLRSWFLSLIQKNWPFSWFKGQKALKEIISREINLDLAEEISALKPSLQPMIKLSIVDKIHFNATTLISNIKKNALSFQAQFGQFKIDFIKDEALIPYENKMEDIIHILILQSDNPLGVAQLPLNKAGGKI